MIIAQFSPEDQREKARKLAVVAGLAVAGPEIGGPSKRFIVRKAAIEKPKAHVTIYSNDNEDRAEIGRKLAIVAGIL